MAEFKSILIVGCGNMGGAMLAGWLRGGLDPARFAIVDPVLAEAPAGVELLRDLPADRQFDVVLLGVKPQMFGDVAPALEPLVGSGCIILSILAGVDLATLGANFPRAAACVRVMPNLAAALGKSPMGLAGEGLGAGQRAAVSSLVEPLGQAEWLEEGHMDLVTALVGSGPAFVYRFIDALAAGAEALGMPADQAGRLALAMVEGAARLAASSDLSPGELANRVASPGGTTRAGLDVLDADAAMARLVEQTLRAARDRGAELAADARKKG